MIKWIKSLFTDKDAVAINFFKNQCELRKEYSAGLERALGLQLINTPESSPHSEKQDLNYGQMVSLWMTSDMTFYPFPLMCYGHNDCQLNLDGYSASIDYVRVVAALHIQGFRCKLLEELLRKELNV